MWVFERVSDRHCVGEAQDQRRKARADETMDIGCDKGTPVTPDYREALERYQHDSVAGHLERLRSGSSPLAGIEALLIGLIPTNGEQRRLGCMGVGSAAEFGTTDLYLVELRARSGAALCEALTERLRAAQVSGEIDPSLDVPLAARFLQTTMQGLQLAARAGADFASLEDLAAFAVARLRPQRD